MAHPPPFEPYYLAPPPPEYGYPAGERSGINTLFVSGLPDDVMPREIHNLFRSRPGFESCQLKYTGRANQVVAFATFMNHQSAIAALHSLNFINSSYKSDKTNLASDSTEKATNSNDAIDPENEQTENRTDGACSTLFIANLGPNCTEPELKQYLSPYQGFNSLKVRARGGMPVAFADFEKVEHATEAMNALQGCSLPSSDRGGMHIEYARSKMRKP
ncbi:cell wall integrity protein scw1 [Phtheirospermum japonicum]|uniref:Cell wall integrity protein scw1 n=1 Tax=Phtheirospermum japonicum TaxID=374723 RepID=A0A830BGU3_9LAMI|nr:cell wall integrity protein scw1 [Phtheirospermum japonicum]